MAGFEVKPGPACLLQTRLYVSTLPANAPPRLALACCWSRVPLSRLQFTPGGAQVGVNEEYFLPVTRRFSRRTRDEPRHFGEPGVSLSLSELSSSLLIAHLSSP